MMSGMEARILRLENSLQITLQTLAKVQALADQLKGQQWAQIAPPGQDGGGGGGVFFCAPTAGIAAATGPPATGTPGGPLGGQDIYNIASGAFASVSTSADLYNGMINAVVATKTCVCLQNPDGSFSVVSQSC